MGRETKIQWADATANFWIGCSKVARGCVNCYAETFAHRVGAQVWGAGQPRRYVQAPHKEVPKLQEQSARDGRRRRVFVSSLSDFFDDGHLPLVDVLGRPIYYADDGELSVQKAGRKSYTLMTVADARQRAWELIDRCADLDFMILTKRYEAVEPLWYNGQRRENVWLGVSAATDAEYTRAMAELDKLRHLARFTFISAEPMVENITPRLDGFLHVRPPDLVIVGGESGGNARECRMAWIRQFVKARQRSPHGAKLFVKQLGARVPDHPGMTDPKGGDPHEWPADLRLRELPGADG